MKLLLFANRLILILAQSTGSLAEGASKAMGIVMLIGFIFGTICVVGGGFAIRRGDTDAGKLDHRRAHHRGRASYREGAVHGLRPDGSTVDVGSFE